MLTYTCISMAYNNLIINLEVEQKTSKTMYMLFHMYRLSFVIVLCSRSFAITYVYIDF